MTTQTSDIPISTVDARSLAALITELNIARRNCGAYPKGHPVITASLTKVLNVYEDLLHKHKELILGVTSDALMVDGVIFEKSNLVYRDFSRALFERGIGVLLFHSGLTIEELNNFTVILSLKREQILQHGGIEQVWAKANINAMTIRPIRYDLFQSTDDGSVTEDTPLLSGEGLWDKFARELSLKELSYDNTRLDPEILAIILNEQFALGSISEAMIREAVANFLAPDGTISSYEISSDHPYQKLATFISNLTPELRRQFLDSSFADNNQNRQATAEHIINNLSESAILETIEDINNNRLNVSPAIFALLQRLGKNISSTENVTEEIEGENELLQKMKTIFQEHATEEFVPVDYQEKLDYIISSDRISSHHMEDATYLMKTVGNRSIENSIGKILINFVREGVETPEERELLLQNLRDMFGFFLETGDYGQLHLLVDQLTDSTFPVELQNRLRDEYGRQEYIEEILDGLTTWGKPRYGDIRSLIHKFGGKFVETILNRLSEEKNMSIRRFFIDCLIEMGPVTRQPIVNRLNDKRWYFLRNLLIILTSQNDPDVVSHIRPLLRSADIRLRHEALKALVHFNDPQAEKIILDDLESQNLERQTSAIQLAERCTSPTIINKLISLLTSGGFSQAECDKKSSIVHALGEIGRAEVLPELAKILSCHSLFRSRQLTKLKKDVIRSFPKYSPTVSRPLLEHIAKGYGGIAKLATETLKIISGKQA